MIYIILLHILVCIPHPGGTWDLSSSVPGNNDLEFQHLINTPRILELDVNRMMYGQNQVIRPLPTMAAMFFSFV